MGKGKLRHHVLSRVSKCVEVPARRSVAHGGALKYLLGVCGGVDESEVPEV